MKKYRITFRVVHEIVTPVLGASNCGQIFFVEMRLKTHHFSGLRLLELIINILTAPSSWTIIVYFVMYTHLSGVELNDGRNIGNDNSAQTLP